MEVKIVEIQEADVITHSGKFHADDVLSTALLSLVFERKGRDTLRVARVDKNLDFNSIASDIIIYDVGNGKFDHHSSEKKRRMNDGPCYAAFGLLWQEFGRELVDDEDQFAFVDEKLVRCVDIHDNKDKRYANLVTHDASELISQIAKSNPTWNDQDVNSPSNNFVHEVMFARTKILSAIKRAKHLPIARGIIENQLKQDPNLRILVLDEFVHWQDALPAKHPIVFCVYPNSRGGYAVHSAINLCNGVRRNAKELPGAWGALEGKRLAEVCGVTDAKFCHEGLYICGAASKEGAMMMARLAIENR